MTELNDNQFEDQAPINLDLLKDPAVQSQEKFNLIHRQLSELTDRVDFTEDTVSRVQNEVTYGGYNYLDDEDYDAKVAAAEPPPPFDYEPEEEELEYEGGDDLPRAYVSDEESSDDIDTEEEDDEPPEGVMAFWQHLEEMRWVIFKCIATLALTTITGIFVYRKTYYLVTYPLMALKDAGKVEVFYQTPTAAVMVMLKIGFLSGICVSLPVLLYFIWGFVSPGLKQKEKRMVKGALFVGFFFFFFGAAFGYFLLPHLMGILVEFGDPAIKQRWYLGEYVSFCVKLILSFGLVFEMPVVIGTIARMGLVEAETLVKGRPYAVVIILILAAVLTPPDVASQIALGLPMMGLYEISILVARWQEKKVRNEFAD